MVSGEYGIKHQKTPPIRSATPSEDGFPLCLYGLCPFGNPSGFTVAAAYFLGGFRNHPFECDLLLCFNGCGDFSWTIGTDLALGWRLAPKSAHWWLRFISLYTKSVQHLAEGEQSVRYYFGSNHRLVGRGYCSF